MTHVSADPDIRPRVLAYLRREGEASPWQIAAALGVSSGSVRSALARLRAAQRIVRVGCGRGLYAVVEA